MEKCTQYMRRQYFKVECQVFFSALALVMYFIIIISVYMYINCIENVFIFLE